MQTERIGVAVRPRRGWEAVDLGFRMARVWWRPLLGAWLVVVLPVAILLHVLFIEHLWAAMLLLWWLKPAFDRVVLHVVSEGLFGHVPRVRDTLAALPRLLRSGVGRSLTWLRLSPLRTFSMPVLQLEGLRGPRGRERTRLLIGREANVGIGLFFACAHFEFVLWIGLYRLMWSMVPDEAGLGFWEMAFQTEAVSLQLLQSALYLAAMTIVEPFYVAGGFALYINRRIYLEGWDIDLTFRKLVQRVDDERARVPAAVLGPLLLAAVCLGAPTLAHADSSGVSCVAERPQDARTCILGVLAEPELARTEEVTSWVPKNPPEPEEEVEIGWLTKLLFPLAQLMGMLVESLVWIGLAIATIALAVLIWRRVESRSPPPSPVSEPETRFGLDVRPESLPDDLVATAGALFAAGDAIGALSLLYRGALVHLTSARGLELPASATEGECTRIARRALEAPLASDFQALTSAWQLCAYGQRVPGAELFSELCRRWQPHLEAAA